MWRSTCGLCSWRVTATTGRHVWTVFQHHKGIAGYHLLFQAPPQVIAPDGRLNIGLLLKWFILHSCRCCCFPKWRANTELLFCVLAVMQITGDGGRTVCRGQEVVLGAGRIWHGPGDLGRGTVRDLLQGTVHTPCKYLLLTSNTLFSRVSS